MPSPLRVLAGPDALAELRERGLSAARVRVFVGASGGPKWLVLHGLDRVLLPWLAQGDAAATPLHAVGSSIGSWRAACLATRDPALAIDRLADAYVEQRYSRRPSAATVSAEGVRILSAALGEEPLARLLEHPRVRLHVVTARFRHLGAREGRAQSLGLAFAAIANTLHRRALGLAVERVVFDVHGEAGPFAPWRSLPTTHVTLTAANVAQALHATAAIPAVMSGVIDPSGAPRGTYRDGGVTDYHFGSEIDCKDGLALYPHFYPHLIPGWFDKPLPWRRTRQLRRVVLLTPSPGFVAALPGSRIPDRSDFASLDNDARIRVWRSVLTSSRVLGEAFGELLASGKIADAAEPL